MLGRPVRSPRFPDLDRVGLRYRVVTMDDRRPNRNRAVDHDTKHRVGDNHLTTGDIGLGRAATTR